MKNVFFSAATLLLFMLASTALHAQKTATWKGGAPGRATAWACAQNWKEGRVPDEFSNVVIPDVSTASFCQPVIDGVVEPVNSVTILSGAQLRIGRSGVLEILGWTETVGTGCIDNKGILHTPQKGWEPYNSPMVTNN